jgi:hypothetical protein
MRFGIFTAGTAVLFTSVLAWSAQQWPRVEEVHKHFDFADVDSAGFDLELKESGGEQRSLYLLKCHSGQYEGGSGFDYSGLLDCRLVSLYSKETVSSLLTETSQQIADWHDRGRFLASHLRKGCAAYPEWGQKRSFRLRGMDITISISDVVFAPPPSGDEKVKSYSVDVIVTSDPTGDTPLTQRPKTPEPPWFYGTAKACDGA